MTLFRQSENIIALCGYG